MSAAAAAVSACLRSNRLIRLRHNRPQAGRRLRALPARNEARISPAAEMEMFSRLTGIQHQVPKVRSTKADRIVIPAKTETKIPIPISITIKSRVTIRKIRRSHPRRPRRRATIGTIAIGIDVIAPSS